MICKECGKILSDYKTECTYCGEPQPNAIPRPKKKSFWWLWALLSVIIITAVVLILLKLL